MLISEKFKKSRKFTLLSINFLNTKYIFGDYYCMIDEACFSLIFFYFKSFFLFFAFMKRAGYPFRSVLLGLSSAAIKSGAVPCLHSRERTPYASSGGVVWCVCPSPPNLILYPSLLIKINPLWIFFLI